MLEEEQKEWLEIFEREFLDRLHNPATLADSVASGALLRINDVVFSPDTGEDISTILNMLDKKGSVYILARDGATGPDGKVYTIDSGVLVGAEKTTGGLTKEHLMYNSKGRIVSKKRHTTMKQRHSAYGGEESIEQ